MTAPIKRKTRFFRAGGSDQFDIQTVDDLRQLPHLDFKLWAALACPISGLNIDKRSLSLCDSDGDGRVRAPELLEAVAWTLDNLRDTSTLMDGSETLSLDAIDTEREASRDIADTAADILTSLDKADATEISVDDASEALRAFYARPFNGDGIITRDATDDEALQQTIDDIVGLGDAPEDRSEQPGIDADTLGAFFEAARDFADWWQTRQDAEHPKLKADTQAAFDAYTAVRGRIDDYFIRCRLAAFDPNAAEALHVEKESYAALMGTELTDSDEALRRMPLSKTEAGKPLPLNGGINPTWAAPMRAFADAVATPLLGEKTELIETDWNDIKAAFAPFEAWHTQREAAPIDSLDPTRIADLAKSDEEKKLADLIAKDEAEAPKAERIELVEKLVRFHRDIARLVNNYVALREFYVDAKTAAFQNGRLFMDRRECLLCLPVEDDGRHAAQAHRAGLLLAYCDCTRQSDGAQMSIVAAFTDGDAEGLSVGRNGVFIDIDGKDWDATITRVIENPTSVKQAFWTPYRKLIRFVEDQVAKRASESSAKADERLLSGVESAEAATQADAPAPAPAPAKKLDIGVVAALGVAVGGITAAFGVLAQAFFGLGFWMPLGILGLLLAISGPSMLIAWLKIRRRHLAPLLDANGWALNAQCLVSTRQGTRLTRSAHLPRGAKVVLASATEKKSNAGKVILLLILLLGLVAALWLLGHIPHFPSPLGR
ncbi:MAG: hypothetical protein M0R76_07695 [Proteobacteria bacterium]|nr:hypothetical protein [Pseudomonadota bacterium]